MANVLPCAGVTGAVLRRRWQEYSAPGRVRVLCFYGAGRDHGHFSNFYIHQPFEFEVPDWCRIEGQPHVVGCAFLEQAIMLCKAGVMKDAEAYANLVAVRNPKDAKSLGRGVRHFDDELWQEVVCSVAYEVVMQKFSKVEDLKALLLATGDRLLAEAAPNDPNWGIGLSAASPDAHCPRTWRGSNILGWALMEARANLVGRATAGKEDEARSDRFQRKRRWPASK